jgi:hypothetical protein
LNNYVVLKLVSNEMLMAELAEVYETGISVKRPIQVRMVPTIKDGEVAEEPVVSIYCQFTYDEYYDFENSNIIYCKSLVDKIIPFYIKTAAGLYDVEITNVKVKEYDQGIDALKEEPTFTVVDLDKSKIVH